MNTELLFTFSFVALGVVAVAHIFFSIVLWLRIQKLQRKSEIFFAGRNGANLESTILSQMAHIKKLGEETKELYDVCEKIHSLASKGLYKTGYVRFNPFKDVGSNQSFAIALLDGKNNGIVLSSLFTREGTRVYAKPIIQGKPSQKYPFTEEEEQAINSASAQKFQEA